LKSLQRQLSNIREKEEMTEGVRIYVGNLPFKTTDEELKELFCQFGDVLTTSVIRYRESKRSKGYAFVSMDEEAAAIKAVDNLNEQIYMDRPLKVKLANQRLNFPRDEVHQPPKTLRFAID